MKTKTEREKYNFNKSLERYEVAVKFLTRPYENKLTLTQSIAIQTVLDRVSHEQRKCKEGKLGNIKIVQEMKAKLELAERENRDMEKVIKHMTAETNNRLQNS